MSNSSLCQLSSHEQEALREYLTRIGDLFRGRILSATLFGSKARGDFDQESDIDVLILVDSEDDELRTSLWHIASDLSTEYGVVLSPRVISQGRWQKMQRMQLPLYQAIREDGLPIDEVGILRPALAPA